MKNFILTNVFFTLAFVLNCNAQLVEISNGKQIDERLVGTWEGS